MRTHRIAIAIAMVATAALLGACADGSGDQGETPDPPASPSAPVSPPATPRPPMPTLSPPATPQTLTGQVVEGGEVNCVLLRTADGTEYLLVGDIDELSLEATATVRGYPDRGMMTTCQQGIPFVVDEVVSP